jgi:hypothetical protein
MRNIAQTTDNFLFDKVFQPFSEWFQKLVGINNFWLARTCAFLAGMCYVVHYGLSKRFVLMGFINIGLSAYFALINIPQLERIVDNFKYSRTSNPARINILDQILRLLSIILVVFILGLLLFKPFSLPRMFDLGSQFFFFCMMYFLACTPLPPGTSRFKMMWNSLWYKEALN